MYVVCMSYVQHVHSRCTVYDVHAGPTFSATFSLKVAKIHELKSREERQKCRMLK
jgi:hypothetical protein